MQAVLDASKRAINSALVAPLSIIPVSVIFNAIPVAVIPVTAVCKPFTVRFYRSMKREESNVY